MRIRTWLICAWGCLLLTAPGAVAAGRSPTSALLVSAQDRILAVLVLAAMGPSRPVLLFDSRFPGIVDRYKQENRNNNLECLRRRDDLSETVTRMEQSVGAPCETVEGWLSLPAHLWPDAKSAIAASAQDDVWLLRAAAFAGATDSAVLVLDPAAPPPVEQLRSLALQTLYITPPVARWETVLSAAVPHTQRISHAEELTRELVTRLPNPPTVLVVANPADQRGTFSPSSLSLLAPLISAAHKAPLFLTERREAAAVEGEALAFLDATGLAPTHVILVGDELALRSHRVPDPVLAAGGPEARGGGTEVRVELFSAIHNNAPQDLIVGRIVAENPMAGSALLARRFHQQRREPAAPVHFLVNADSVFQLGEAISRTTVNDLRNAGISVKALYREEVSPKAIAKALATTDLLVWEGHPRDLTLKESGGIAVEEAPDYVFLQGCYTLDRSDPFILIENGTQAIVGTSAAVYSAPGSGFVRALFEELLYDSADLGTAVRNARNYLFAVARLQQERGHWEWRKTLRAALAFALWGDPTLRLPLSPGKPRLRSVQWSMGQNSLTLEIPDSRFEEVAVGRFRANPAPRAMLSGLVVREGEQLRVKDLYFTAARVSARAACAPASGWDVVSLYAPRTGTLFFLARPDWTLVHSAGRSGTFSFPLVTDPEQCASMAAPATPPR